MNMNELTHHVRRWLASNMVETEGVRIVLEFPTEREAIKAEMAIKRELQPMERFYRTGDNFGQIETMNGLGLILRVKPKTAQTTPMGSKT